MHTFPLAVTWSGTTATREYTRDAEATTGDKPPIPLSAGGGYGGDDTRWNPEDLLGASLSMCHMLTFLALAAKTGLDVRGYTGDTDVVLDTVDKVTRVTTITLKPTITLGPGADAAKAADLFEKAHKYCFIANSVTAEVVMSPTFY